LTLTAQPSSASARPVLETEEVALWTAYRGAPTPSGRERLFGYYFPFARAIANRLYRSRNHGDVELAEISQLAAAGLLEAIDHFDPDRGAPFRAYASRRISGSILDGLAKLTEAREQYSLRHRMRNDRIRSLTPDEPDKLSPAAALQALIEAAVGLAIGYMLEDTGLYVDEAKAVERAPNAYDSLAWRELVLRMMQEVGSLPDREQLIVRHHYLNGLTFDQIGEMLDVTKGRVSQLHRLAMERLRQGLGRQGHFRLER
jgi:RNA polymerase sigma factor FliA